MRRSDVDSIGDVQLMLQLRGILSLVHLLATQNLSAKVHKSQSKIGRIYRPVQVI